MGRLHRGVWIEAAMFTIAMLGAWPARAQSGRLNLRAEAGPNWTPIAPMPEKPVNNPGFHGALQLDAPLLRWMNVLGGADIDTFASQRNERDKPVFFAKGGIMLNPLNFQRGLGWLESSAGVAFLQSEERFGFSFGAGYQTYFGRLGLGPYGRYTQIVIPSGTLDGKDIKMATFGLAGAVTVIPHQKPRMPAVAPTPVIVVRDVDGDGVPDDRDRCLGTTFGKSVDVDGCQVVVKPMDSDEDGVADTEDRCPQTRSGESVDAAGCSLPPPPPPAPVDADADGVPDTRDECLGTTQGFPVSSVTGCGEVPDKFQLPLIKFKASSAVLEDESLPQIKELADLMAKNPRMRIKIVGHAGEDGSRPKHLRQLGHRRAHAVEGVLRKNGISTKRVMSVGAKRADYDGVEFLVRRR